MMQPCIFTSFIQNFPKGEFNKCRTSVQRMDLVYQKMEERGMIPLFKEDKKDDTIATMLRETGNDLYKAGNYRAALNQYTLSLLNAKSKKLLALAFANRSAALLKLNLYEECLIEITRALESGYPDNLKPKLIARRTFCKGKKSVKRPYYQPTPKFPESERNSKICCARNSVKIVKNEQYGKHVLATRTIEIGEILAVENPYSAMIENQVYVHCHECFDLCYNMIPCDNCTKTLYCSSTCKDKAFNTYHKYECPILLSLDFLVPVLDSPKRLALKTVLLGKNEWSDVNLVGGDDEEYRSDRFKEIHNLEGHINTRDTDNLLTRTTVACSLFALIKNHSKFLKDCGDEDRFKEILLLTILICGVNTVGIDEVCPTILGIYDLKSIGIAVYPFFTRFNHSCWPNVSRHFHGTTMVMRALNTIQKGQQCFVCYGPYFASYVKEFRQTFLKDRQLFTCTCRACRENWSGDYNGLVNEWSLFYVLIRKKFAEANVNVAKEELGQLLVKAKKAERELPPGRDYMIKELLAFCYHILGNNRRL